MAIKTPQERKRQSEARLTDRSIPINRNLPMIEPEDHARLRTPQELLQRMVALWAVAGTALVPGDDFFRDYLKEHGLLDWLSPHERAFVLGAQPHPQDVINASWQLEGLYFLAWCGGLIERIDLPAGQSTVDAFIDHFPKTGEGLSRLESALAVRSVSEVLDWSDLLYRTHWAVRDAQLCGTAPPPGIDGEVVTEWHRAVNWMTRLGDEDEWESVPIDT